ncbi:NAD(P)-dependent oxidoreductase [Halomonas denitrificans]|nr:NAD(P)-dependent oxidoreductase [Halomonas denitrificans]
MKTGWIGLGAMGAPMAGHLHAAGLLHGAWNRGAARRDAFADAYPDAAVAESPEALAEAVDVLALCVSADADLAAVLDRVADRLAPGTVVVDHSTVSPAAARSAHARLTQREVAFVDAPVTGGVEGAKNGQLAILVGGDAEAVQTLHPLFDAYGKVWKHLGPPGSGQAAKAVNQLIVAGIAEAVCEALALVEKLDLPADDMLELLGGGAAGNWFLDKRGRTMLADSFETGFEPALLLKDLKICRALADEAGLESTVLPGAIADYQRLVDGGETGRDISALIRLKR